MMNLPRGVNEKSLINKLRDISWEVSDLFKSYEQKGTCSEEFKKNLNIQNVDNAPVTDADIYASKLIKSKIIENFPNASWDFLSEEDKKIFNFDDFQSDWIWVIDPLDGTKDFIGNTGEYAMHIALTFKKKTVLAFVLIPSKEELWIFCENNGSWCEDRQRFKKPINIYKNFKKLNEIKILVSRSHRHKDLTTLLAKIEPLKVIGMGSIGFKITSILRGEADFYISYSTLEGSSPKDWDFAAPAAILKGAGGDFTNIYSEEVKLLNNENFEQVGVYVASINSNHSEICNEIRIILENL